MANTETGLFASVDYWEQNARWYELWAAHGNYHEPILRQLLLNVQPHWHVLDIGAGNGLLSFSLAALGCRVTAIEPCSAMRRLFFREAWRRGIGHVLVDERAWSAFISGGQQYDLVIACNSLHVCEEGMTGSFRRIIGMWPRNIFVVTETGTEDICAQAAAAGYVERWRVTFEQQSPHVYHSLDDAFEHWRFRCMNGATAIDEPAFASQLRLSQGHWYFDETVHVSLLWWRDGETF